jgi:hypothetical protein
MTPHAALTTALAQVQDHRVGQHLALTQGTIGPWMPAARAAW